MPLVVLQIVTITANIVTVAADIVSLLRPFARCQ
jgi:hypothetical protein